LGSNWGPISYADVLEPAARAPSAASVVSLPRGTKSHDRRVEVLAVRLEWEGKPTHVERVSLPFQTVETINESRATRERDAGGLFAGSAASDGARNRLIWGDNKLVMSSLLAGYAGKIKLIYIDPPFATGDDFTHRVALGDASVAKRPSVLEEHAYRDTWGAGYESYLSMMYARLVLLHELLDDAGSL